MPVLTYFRQYANHVFLAFDRIGVVDQTGWASLVSTEDSSTISTMARVTPYYQVTDLDLSTFSFHPYSVLTGGNEYDEFSVAFTSGSYVAYNDPIDKGAFQLANSSIPPLGYKVYPIEPMSDALQFALYKAATNSRNVNNTAPEVVDPRAYSAIEFDCGSWVQYIVEKYAEFPRTPGNFSINLGVGLSSSYGNTPFYYLGRALTTAARFLFEKKPDIQYIEPQILPGFIEPQ